MRNRDREYFADWLTRTLAERDIAGGEVARALGVNDSAVSRWKNGKSSIGIDSAKALAEFLGLPPIEVIVTAGIMDEGTAGVMKLPLPRETKMLGYVEDQLMRIRGLDDETRKALIETARNRFTAVEVE